MTFEAIAERSFDDWNMRLVDLYDLVPTQLRTFFPEWPITESFMLPYPTDDGLVSFDDPIDRNDPTMPPVDLPDVAVGRLPAITVNEANAMVDRAIAFAGDVIRAGSSDLSRSHSPRLGRYISANLAVFLLYAVAGGMIAGVYTDVVQGVLMLVAAVAIYRLFRFHDLWAVLRDSTRQSVMILFIIGAAGVFAYMLSSLFVTQAIAEWIGGLDVKRWVLVGGMNVFLLVAGFFLPPVAVMS